MQYTPIRSPARCNKQQKMDEASCSQAQKENNVFKDIVSNEYPQWERETPAA